MTNVTIIGNLTADPELRFTNTAKAVVSFTVAESQRVRGGDGGWKDGDSTFWRCTLWDSAAENLAESLHKGQRVIVVGEAKQRSFETRDGEKRTVIEVTASEVGPSLRWAVAKVEKTSGNGPRTVSQTQNPSGNGDDADPWGTAAHNADDEIPF